MLLAFFYQHPRERRADTLDADLPKGALVSGAQTLKFHALIHCTQ